MVDYKKLPSQPLVKSTDTGLTQIKDKQVESKANLPQSKPLVDAQKSRIVARIPVDFGKKIAEQRVLYQPQAQRHQFQGRRQLSPEMKGLLAKAFQSLLGEPQLQQRRGSDLSQFLEERFTELARGSAQGLRKIPLELLQRLFKARHGFEDKSKVFMVLRFELAKLKEERSQDKERVRATEGSDDETKAGEGRQADKTATRLEKEAFLKRTSHTLKNLNPDEAESPFEALLKKVLGGKESVPNNAEGKKSQFKGKSEEEWQKFFKNVLLNGSEEASQTHHTDNILDALYRGLFKNLSSQKGMTLVTDLQVSTGDKALSEKFARIAIENPQLIEKLSQLKPGDDLPKELLKLLGDSVELTKLVNKTEVPNSETGAQLLAQLKHQMNPHTLSRLEQQLIEERKKQAKNSDTYPGLLWGGATGQGSDQPASYLGRDFENKNLLPPGRPKFWLFMAYSLSALVITLILYLFLKSIG